MGWETEIANVAAGNPITALRANQIRDKIVHVVADVASLPTDVAEGGIAYVLGNDRVYRWDGAQWRMEGIEVYTSSAARTTNNPTPVHGDFSFLTDTNSLEFFDGSSWSQVGTAGESVENDHLVDGDNAVQTATDQSVNNFLTTTLAIPGTWSTYQIKYHAQLSTAPFGSTGSARIFFHFVRDTNIVPSIPLSPTDPANPGVTYVSVSSPDIENTSVGMFYRETGLSTTGTRTINVAYQALAAGGESGNRQWGVFGYLFARAEKLT